MDMILTPGKLEGTVQVIPSKSQAHRALICAAFADRPTRLLCPQTNRDMEATAGCLRALGAEIQRTVEGYLVTPGAQIPRKATLCCHDSGSTLRFLLPMAGALGVEATFLLEGRLAKRPLSPLWEEMERMGCHLSRPGENTLLCTGNLRPGDYTLDGGVSSQFITGLLLALTRVPGKSRISITGTMESRPYVTMTQRCMEAFGVESPNLTLQGGSPFRSPGVFRVEGDWSNGAFWLAANALGSRLDILGLDSGSCQGDRAAAQWIPALREHQTISARDIPDLVPILAIVAACNRGAEFRDIRRLRLKESDRVASVMSMVEALGGRASATEETLTIYGTGLVGGTVDAVNDHRIAMAAAIAATACREPVRLLGAQCAEKSYPQFFGEYARLGGQYEQYLR